MILRGRLSLVLLFVGLAACGSGGSDVLSISPDTTTTSTPRPSTAPMQLVGVSQATQAGMPGELLELPIVTRVMGGALPLAGVVVAFEPRAGSVSADAVLTDKNGEARVSWRMPSDLASGATATLLARIVAQPSAAATFTARAPKDAEMDLVVSDEGKPVQLIAYRSGDFDSTSLIRRTFTDSAHLYVPEPAYASEVVAYTAGRAPVLLTPKWTAGRDTIRISFAKEVVRMPITI